ncbi:hypothetical protein N665_1367s0002 [Sinapis alba]|nr:hypothetical protein N665_1367s0002 [Sinapis alba]
MKPCHTTSNQRTHYRNRETAKSQPSKRLQPWLIPDKTHESEETRSTPARKLPIPKMKKNRFLAPPSSHQLVGTPDRLINRQRGTYRRRNFQSSKTYRRWVLKEPENKDKTKFGEKTSFRR